MKILIVSHQGVASGMKDAAKMIVGDTSKIHAIELTQEGVDVFSNALESYLKDWLVEGQGIILADLKGGTPFNQAELILSKLNKKDCAKVIAGVNLPLVLELLFKEIDINNIDELKKVVEMNRLNIDCMDLYNQKQNQEDE